MTSSCSRSWLSGQPFCTCNENRVYGVYGICGVKTNSMQAEPP